MVEATSLRTEPFGQRGSGRPIREQRARCQCSAWSGLRHESHRLHDKGRHAVKLAISASAQWRSLASIVSRLIILTPHASPPPCPPTHSAPRPTAQATLSHQVCHTCAATFQHHSRSSFPHLLISHTFLSVSSPSWLLRTHIRRI
jgi:hypothetical protein